MVISDCLRGTTFTFSAQALYPDTVSSVASSSSRPITIPPSVPGTMPAPTVVASAVDPSTMMIISWPQLSTGYLTGGSPIIDLTISILKTSDGIGQVVTVAGTQTQYTAMNLQQDTEYLIRTQVCAPHATQKCLLPFTGAARPWVDSERGRPWWPRSGNRFIHSFMELQLLTRMLRRNASRRRGMR